MKKLLIPIAALLWSVCAPRVFAAQSLVATSTAVTVNAPMTCTNSATFSSTATFYKGTIPAVSTGSVVHLSTSGLMTGTTDFTYTPGSSASATSTPSTASFTADQAGDGSTTPLTFNATASGSDTYLLLACTSVGGATPITSAPTFNGDAMTLLSSAAATAYNYYTYGLVNPDTGEHVVSVAWSDGEVPYTCETASLAGVAQTSSIASIVFSTVALTTGQSITNAPTTAAGTAVFSAGFISDYIGPNSGTLRYATAGEEIAYPGTIPSSYAGMALTQRSGATTNNTWTFTGSGTITAGNVSVVLNPSTSATVTPGVVLVGSGAYFQASKRNAGAPTSGDCDADSEWGRIAIDTTNNRLYICNGASRGWDYVGLTN